MLRNFVKTALFIAITTPITCFADGVDIGGEIISYYAVRKEKHPFSLSDPGDLTSGKVATHGLNNHAALNFKVDKTHNDLNYGAFIRLHANTSAASTNEESVADKAYLWAQHNKIGRIEVGSINGVAGMLRVDTMGLAKGGYGVEGFNSILHSSTTLKFPRIKSVTGREFITQPHIPSNFSGHHYADANKINLYTKPLDSLVVGVSYIPNLDATGTSSSFNVGKYDGPNDERGTAGHSGTFNNVISGAIQYKFNIKDYNFKLLASGEVGTAKKVKTQNDTYERVLRNLKAVEFGASLDYNNWHLGAVYGNWFKSGTYKQPFKGTKQGAFYTSYEVSQEIGDFAWSLTYMMSKRAGGVESLAASTNWKSSKDARNEFLYYTTNGMTFNLGRVVDYAYNKYWNISLGGEYKLAPGLLPFAEVSMFDYTESGASSSNRGFIYILGTKLLF